MGPSHIVTVGIDRHVCPEGSGERLEEVAAWLPVYQSYRGADHGPLSA